MKFKLFWAWYDFWVGLYYDRKRKILYLGFPPTVMWSFASDENTWTGSRWKHLSEYLYSMFVLCSEHAFDLETEVCLKDGEPCLKAHPQCTYRERDK